MSNIYLEKIAGDNKVKQYLRKEYEKQSPERAAAIGAGITAGGSAGVAGLGYAARKHVGIQRQKQKMEQKTVSRVNTAKRRAEYLMKKKGYGARQASAEAVGTLNRRSAKKMTKLVRRDALRTAGKMGKAVAVPGSLAVGASYLLNKAQEAYGKSGLKDKSKK